MSFWTPDKFEDLKQRVSRGDSASEIAAAFNEIYKPEKPMTRNAITGKVHRSGLVLGQYQGSPEAIQRRIKARKEAAKESNVRTHSTRKARAKGEAPPPKPKATFSFGRGPGAAKPMPSPKVEPISTAPSALAVAFFDRKRMQCSYIWDAAPHAHSMCCGAPITPGAKYAFCPTHLAKVISTQQPRNKTQGVAA